MGFSPRHFFRSTTVFVCLLLSSVVVSAEQARIAYVVSDIRIPFWEILKKGMAHRAEQLGYTLNVYTAENSAKTELANMLTAINSGVKGVIISPTNSSAAVTMLKLADQAEVPVVIADIGADEGQYVSYIASNNYQGSYEIGKMLTEAMKEAGLENGRVGIIAIPQKRSNGQMRTAGFMQAMNAANVKVASLLQQTAFTRDETYQFAHDLLLNVPDLAAIWLQTSQHYQAALDAIDAAGKRDQVLLISFDAEPEYLSLIRQEKLVGAGMQQPFLMGEEAANALVDHLEGEKVKKEILLPVLPVSADSIDEQLPVIQRNVLGVIP